MQCINIQILHILQNTRHHLTTKLENKVYEYNTIIYKCAQWSAEAESKENQYLFF